MPIAEQSAFNWGPQMPSLEQEQQNDSLSVLATVYDDNYSQISQMQDAQFEPSEPDSKISSLNMQQILKDFALSQDLQDFVQSQQMSSDNLEDIFKDLEIVQEQPGSLDDDPAILKSETEELNPSENSEIAFEEANLENVSTARNEIWEHSFGATEDEASSFVHEQYPSLRGEDKFSIEDLVSMIPNSMNMCLESLNNGRSKNLDEIDYRTREEQTQSADDNNNDNSDNEGFIEPKGENFKINLNDFSSIRLNKFAVYTPKKTKMRNLRYIFSNDDPDIMRVRELVDEHDVKNFLGKRDALALEEFRQRNTFTVEDCIYHQELLKQQVLQSRSHELSLGITLEELDPSLFSNYTQQEVPEPESGYLYTPIIRKTYSVLDAEKKPKLITEGLCPYCPVIKFGKMKNSNYGHHLSIIHGVQTNGRGIPDPVSYGFYYCEKLNKQNWSNTMFEGVLCPVDGCLTVCKVSKLDSTGESRNRLLDYLRHYKSAHKSGRLLDLMRRNLERSATTTTTSDIDI